MNILNKRGTTSKVAEYVGKSGELVFDIETNTLHVMDGVSKGGISIANKMDIPSISSPTVFITSTGGDKSCWYRVWSDNTVECGGYKSAPRYGVDTLTITVGHTISSNSIVLVSGTNSAGRYNSTSLRVWAMALGGATEAAVHGTVFYYIIDKP